MRVPAIEMPLGILYNPQLTFGARVLYGALARYQTRGTASGASQTTLARDLGCTARSVRNYLAELGRVGMVTVEPRTGRDAAHYHLRFTI